MRDTLKGVLVVAQSGGPTPVINASLAGVIREAQRLNRFSKIYGLVHGIEGALKEELLDLTNETPANLEWIARTPASALGSCRHKLSLDDYDRILDVFKAHDVRAFAYIGGNDSMDTCHRISKLAQDTAYDMQIMGIPKTMDNDLAYTDHCPGFGSAARFLALATRDTGRDLEAMKTFDDVTILEALGRNAGWLTLSAALGKQDEDDAPHLVYTPEIPFDEDHFLQDVARIHERLGRVFVVVSEGIRDSRGEFIGAHAQVGGGIDNFGHVVHSLSTGVAAYLTDVVRARLKVQARFLRPSLIGRALSACTSEIDRQEAWQVGVDAIKHFAVDETGYMVTIERLSSDPYQWETGLATLSQVANTEKLLPREYINQAGNLPTPAFFDYALPLIDPLPTLGRLQGKPVAKIIYS